MTASSKSTALGIALLGFGDFERSALLSYLRLSGTRVPAYKETDSLTDANFLVVDADHVGTLDSVLSADRVADTVFVGTLAPEGALAWMMRPIDPRQVFREIDAALAQRKSRAPAAPEAVNLGAAPMPPVAETAPGEKPAAGAWGARRAGDVSAPIAALLVDDSEIALRLLERQLQAMGLRTETAADSQRALELLAQQAYDVVFLDVDLGPHSEVDGLTLCQRIKRQPPRTASGGAPVVVMVSAHTSTTDRVRGSFAGCDVFMTKPLDEETLRRSLRALGLRVAAGPDASHPSSRPGTLNTLPLPRDPSR